MPVSVSTAARNAMMDGLSTTIGASAYLRFYSGTRPANVAAALSGTTLLAELRGNASGWAPAATVGAITANAITADSSADNSGTVTFARQFKSDGTTAVADYSVGTGGTDIIVNTVTVVATANFSCSSFVLTDGNT
jgi:hypothetical protein